MATVSWASLGWRKSSYSGGGSNGSCVEMAFAGDLVAVRDSKSSAAGALLVSASGWRGFLAGLENRVVGLGDGP
ncbi:uncharacterized protein DUF397 [Tamaricihabitans halophyticus]|uniref:Uncharacterized protein DUF397 n=1 Tax=Tamaricihabitans halophyticus TaxID=1262583 RepID=A0A4R2QBE7_9PSEU|nr:DUF397 domain-containing protein [Tamaricihabitans halophyticus]TCP46302.1 uncharacterized protein DUF397 [Tamaricihabitans halophyticus]